jgi:hypothetical protein
VIRELSERQQADTVSDAECFTLSVLSGCLVVHRAKDDLASEGLAIHHDGHTLSGGLMLDGVVFRNVLSGTRGLGDNFRDYGCIVFWQ